MEKSAVKTQGVQIWLLCIYGLILLMVALGGITRLTGSGLSMVEWHPLMGTLPPMNEEAWRLTFEKYQTSPQYEQVNQWMHLVDFKRIFIWEYLHRLLGRTIGVVFFLPMVWLWQKQKLVGIHRKRALIALFLGGSQGLLGWFMVKSGLVDRPEVSHFRLAAHLSLAFFVAQYIQWMGLSLRQKEGLLAASFANNKQPKRVAPSWNSLKKLRILAVFSISTVILQIIYGAFMAGSRAGFLFATYPDMNGSYWPNGVLTGTVSSAGSMLHDAMHNPIFIHVIHRTLGVFVALLVSLCAFLTWRFSRQKSQNWPATRRASLLLAFAILLQFSLGILTVMTHVTLWIAVLHQVGGLFLLSACTWLLFVLFTQKTEISA